MEITGIIKKIYPLQEGTSKSTGNKWKSMEFLLETEDRYPQSACLQLMNDNCTRFEIKEGDKVMFTTEKSIKGISAINVKIDK